MFFFHLFFPGHRCARRTWESLIRNLLATRRQYQHTKNQLVLMRRMAMKRNWYEIEIASLSESIKYSTDMFVVRPESLQIAEHARIRVRASLTITSVVFLPAAAAVAQTTHSFDGLLRIIDCFENRFVGACFCRRHKYYITSGSEATKLIVFHKSIIRPCLVASEFICCSQFSVNTGLQHSCSHVLCVHFRQHTKSRCKHTHVNSSYVHNANV